MMNGNVNGHGEQVSRSNGLPSVSHTKPYNKDIPECSEKSPHELRENENNTNIENRQLLHCVINPPDNGLNIDHNVCVQTSQKPSVLLNAGADTNDLRMALGNRNAPPILGEAASNGLAPMNIDMRGRRKGIKILPLLLRSANTIDEMDPEAVMELFVQNE
jgi:hypothetical protein